MKRTFIAVKVEPDEKLHKMISSFKSALKTETVKWTNPCNIHITLAFIGDTAEEKISVISKALKDICEGYGEFELIIKGSGVFKSINDPRVIWTGIEPCEKLNNLNKLIKNGLKTAGIRLEERPFKPHLTLGRIKQIKEMNNLKELVDKYSGIEIQRVPVNEVILFESILYQEGLVYKPMVRFTI
jgi:RNA 2',3'-cyclic 3'-phosphodiesterase